MLEKHNLMIEVRRNIDALKVGDLIDIRSYKRNRSVVIYREEEDKYVLLEKGFYEQEVIGDSQQMLYTLKRSIKKEFPRSNKVRIYQHEMANPYEISGMRRGKI
ncbi:hypothetical protein CI610_00841 [invertebrate metagenome]|uniref:Uncharacterized protein n=1 Tax=invertebrate metagenome TaxID=1711999 RepID=A0A2H9TAH7_9ZZZZ